MRNALQIIEENNLPDSHRTKPTLSYATFQPQKNNRARLAILTTPT